jgi:hypothetical protein
MGLNCNEHARLYYNRLVTQKQKRLYYILHKPEINKNRKKYKRQPWSLRKDNPKNKI